MRLVKDYARVKVPATSANLGPGYDSFGLAMDLFDEIEVRATTGSTRVEISGEGAQTLPTDERHLIVRALRRGLDYVGSSQVGIEMHCRNRIPQARGMGSSAAAIIAGFGLARELIAAPEALSDEVILRLATEMEGHPDNLAPALLGGVTISGIEWPVDQLQPAIKGDYGQPFCADSEAEVWALPLKAGEHLKPTVFIPQFQLETEAARALIPDSVPHRHATLNAIRAGLLVQALGDYPEYLFKATADLLHQDYREAAMPPSLEMMYWLRSQGYPATISGAGPTVVSLTEVETSLRLKAQNSGWKVKVLPLVKNGLTVF